MGWKKELNLSEPSHCETWPQRHTHLHCLHRQICNQNKKSRKQDGEGECEAEYATIAVGRLCQRAVTILQTTNRTVACKRGPLPLFLLFFWIHAVNMWNTVWRPCSTFCLLCDVKETAQRVQEVFKCFYLYLSWRYKTWAVFMWHRSILKSI